MSPVIIREKKPIVFLIDASRKKEKKTGGLVASHCGKGHRGGYDHEEKGKDRKKKGKSKRKDLTPELRARRKKSSMISISSL